MWRCAERAGAVALILLVAVYAQCVTACSLRPCAEPHTGMREMPCHKHRAPVKERPAPLPCAQEQEAVRPHVDAPLVMAWLAPGPVAGEVVANAAAAPISPHVLAYSPPYLDLLTSMRV